MIDLETLADRITRRAAGEWDALRDDWADVVVIWHCYDNAEERVTGLARSEGASAELATLSRVLDDFARTSTVHVSETTNTIVETSVWTGRTKTGRDMINSTCVVYSVVDGRIARMDVYDDSNQSRRWAEVLVHGLIAVGDVQ